VARTPDEKRLLTMHDDLWSDPPVGRAVLGVYYTLSGHDHPDPKVWMATRHVLDPASHVVLDGPPTVLDVRAIGDAGWLTYEQHGRTRTTDEHMQLRGTEVYARRDGDWQLEHAHLSMASPRPRPGGI
jgi:hypothetical protein